MNERKFKINKLLEEDTSKLENEKTLSKSMEENRRLRLFVNIATVIGMLLIVAMAVYAYKTGLFTDHEKLKLFIKKLGFWGPIFFILLQIIQCVIPIIPGGVTLIIGVVLFGPVVGFIYNYVGVVIGEVIDFFLARIYGIKVVHALTSPQTFNKYAAWLDKNQTKFDRFFAITMFLPGFPDDVICMLAGLSKMRFRWFLPTLLWTKVPAIILYSLFLEKVINVFIWASKLFS